MDQLTTTLAYFVTMSVTQLKGVIRLDTFKLTKLLSLLLFFSSTIMVVQNKLE